MAQTDATYFFITDQRSTDRTKAEPAKSTSTSSSSASTQWRWV